ncbi:MAG: hypothetical protein JKY89_09990 [Immundisolibacteraceae bacterium]|nr:hypothetical protein [Immundisolibacteraceae bacterium]
MGIRTGEQYIASLKDNRRIFINGEEVNDVADHPAFSGLVQELARHYDRFHDPEKQPIYTYASPKDGAPVSNSYLMPENAEQMAQRVRAETERKADTFGMMGRMPDFMNAFMTDVAAIGYLLGYKDKRFAENAWRYYEYARDTDICFTHTLADPKTDYTKEVSEQRSVRIVDQNSEGIIVSGARMLSTLAPVSNEIFVGAFMPRTPAEAAYAVSFAIPVATDGLKFIAREPYATGKSLFDRPLSERYDEGDAIALFTNVLVPWDRVFVAGDILPHNLMMPSYPGFLSLQANIRGRAKLRFMTGLASKMANSLGRNKQARYQEMIGELLSFCEIADGLISASADEVLRNFLAAQRNNNNPDFVLPDNPDAALFSIPNSGMVAMSALRTFFPMVNTKVNDVVRLIGSSNLVMAPTEADFANPELAAELESYIAGPDMSAKERVRVMKLGWDAIATEFGSRQEIYEIFFAGDPAMARMMYYNTPRRFEYEGQVDQLLAQSEALQADRISN